MGLSLWSVNLGLATTPTVLSDINTYWISQVYKSAQVITLTTATGSVDGTITVSGLTPGIGGYQAGLQSIVSSASGFRPPVSNMAPTLSVGSCFVIDQEPMTITAISGPDGSGNYTLTVSRGPNQTTPSGTTNLPLAVTMAHAAGAVIYPLKYATPWEMVRVECLVPYAQQIVNWMGINSANLSSSINGSVSQ